VRRLLAVAALVGCSGAADGLVDVFVAGEADYGTVYACNSGAMCEGGAEEWCFDGSEAELEQLLGAECHRIGFDERLWPALTGCIYRCDGEPYSGANAHCGTFCR
jgi:hypothetical protein